MLIRTPNYKSALTESIKIIRSIVEADPRPTGYTSHELFKLARKQQPPPSFMGWGKELYSPTPTVAKAKVPDEPPKVDHPVRSISFLKQAVLPLLNTNVIKKTQVNRYEPLTEAEIKLREEKLKQGKPVEGATKDANGVLVRTTKTWAWVVIKPENIQRPSKPKEYKDPKFAVFGFGEDTTHLNRRRRNARPGKIHTAAKRMRTFQEGVQESIEDKLEQNEGALKAIQKKLKDATPENGESLKEAEKFLQSTVEDLTRRQRWFKKPDREMLRV
ncbi:hypothetical protein BDQ17DRAFT_1543782 [Cyathus striatus]|nr:hypothetical protein BDQ17DRAFT_1543782 [Cyathus striatus]